MNNFFYEIEIKNKDEKIEVKNEDGTTETKIKVGITETKIIKHPNIQKPTLADMDRLTLEYGRGDFLKEFMSINVYDYDEVKVRITKRNLEYAYSAIFENKYLEAVIDDLTPKQDKILVASRGYQEMRTYLFNRLEKKDDNFIKEYGRNNAFTTGCNKYRISCEVQSEEGKIENRFNVENLLGRYNNFRSLCGFRYFQEKGFIKDSGSGNVNKLKPGTIPVRKVDLQMPSVNQYGRPIILQPYVDSIIEKSKGEYLTEDEVLSMYGFLDDLDEKGLDGYGK